MRDNTSNEPEPSDCWIMLGVISLFAMIILLALLIGLMQDMRYFCS